MYFVAMFEGPWRDPCRTGTENQVKTAPRCPRQRRRFQGRGEVLFKAAQTN